jgi:hypothetical protein
MSVCGTTSILWMVLPSCQWPLAALLPKLLQFNRSVVVLVLTSSHGRDLRSHPSFLGGLRVTEPSVMLWSTTLLGRPTQNRVQDSRMAHRDINKMRIFLETLRDCSEDLH